jgi:hypothetical protein
MVPVCASGFIPLNRSVITMARNLNVFSAAVFSAAVCSVPGTC